MLLCSVVRSSFTVKAGWPVRREILFFSLVSLFCCGVMQHQFSSVGLPYGTWGPLYGSRCSCCTRL